MDPETLEKTLVTYFRPQPPGSLGPASKAERHARQDGKVGKTAGKAQRGKGGAATRKQRVGFQNWEETPAVPFRGHWRFQKCVGGGTVDPTTRHTCHRRGLT